MLIELEMVTHCHILQIGLGLIKVLLEDLKKVGIVKESLMKKFVIILIIKSLTWISYIANRVGVDKSTIRRFEKGGNCKKESYKKICDYIDISN